MLNKIGSTACNIRRYKIVVKTYKLAAFKLVIACTSWDQANLGEKHRQIKLVLAVTGSASLAKISVTTGEFLPAVILSGPGETKLFALFRAHRIS